MRHEESLLGRRVHQAGDRRRRLFIGLQVILADLQYQYSFAISAKLNLDGVEKSMEGALGALGAPPENLKR